MITDRLHAAHCPTLSLGKRSESSQIEHEGPTQKKVRSEATLSEMDASNSSDNSGTKADTALKLLDTILQKVSDNHCNTDRDFFFHSIGLSPEEGDESKWQIYKSFHDQQLDGLLEIDREAIQNRMLKIIEFPNVKNSLKRDIVNITDKLLSVLAQFHEQMADNTTINGIDKDKNENTSTSGEEDSHDETLDPNKTLFADMQSITSAYTVQETLKELFDIADNDHYFNSKEGGPMFC